MNVEFLPLANAIPVAPDLVGLISTETVVLPTSHRDPIISQLLWMELFPLSNTTSVTDDPIVLIGTILVVTPTPEGDAVVSTAANTLHVEFLIVGTNIVPVTLDTMGCIGAVPVMLAPPQTHRVTRPWRGWSGVVRAVTAGTPPVAVCKSRDIELDMVIYVTMVNIAPDAMVVVVVAKPIPSTTSHCNPVVSLLSHCEFFPLANTVAITKDSIDLICAVTSAFSTLDRIGVVATTPIMFDVEFLVNGR
jgi:hypothetical protein